MAESLADFVSFNDMWKELERLRGRPIGKRTLRRWVAEGLPHIKLGAMVVFHPPTVIAYLERRQRGGLKPPRRRRVREPQLIAQP